MPNSIQHSTVISIHKDVGSNWPRFLSVQTDTRTHFTRLTLGWLDRCFVCFKLGLVFGWFLFCFFLAQASLIELLGIVSRNFQLTKKPKLTNKKLVKGSTCKLPNVTNAEFTSPISHNSQLDLYLSKMCLFPLQMWILRSRSSVTL